MKPLEQIETARLHLRKPQMDDAQAIFETWAQDREVTRTLTWRAHEDVEVTQNVLRGMIAAWEEKTRWVYMILEKETQVAAGMIEIRWEGCKAEIGYVLAHKHWGQGYMTEAAQALTNWALAQPEIYRVYATTSVDNIGSQRVMEKIGMLREGLMRKYIAHINISAEPVDSYLYAIVK